MGDCLWSFKLLWDFAKQFLTMQLHHKIWVDSIPEHCADECKLSLRWFWLIAVLNWYKLQVYSHIWIAAFTGAPYPGLQSKLLNSVGQVKAHTWRFLCWPVGAHAWKFLKKCCWPEIWELTVVGEGLMVFIAADVCVGVMRWLSFEVSVLYSPSLQLKET